MPIRVILYAIAKWFEKKHKEWTDEQITYSQKEGLNVREVQRKKESGKK